VLRLGLPRECDGAAAPALGGIDASSCRGSAAARAGIGCGAVAGAGMGAGCADGGGGGGTDKDIWPVRRGARGSGSGSRSSPRCALRGGFGITSSSSSSMGTRGPRAPAGSGGGRLPGGATGS